VGDNHGSSEFGHFNQLDMSAHLFYRLVSCVRGNIRHYLDKDKVNLIRILNK